MVATVEFMKTTLQLRAVPVFFGLILTAGFLKTEILKAETPYRVGPVSSATGGAGRAATDPTEAGWLNPAALVHARSYHLALSHQQSHRAAGDGYRDFGLMFSDAGEDKLAAGSFSYVQRSTVRGGAGAVTAEQKDFQASLASFIAGSEASIGVTYRRLMHRQSAADLDQDTYSVGLLFPLAKSLGVAVTGTDLGGGSSSAAPEARLIPAVSFAVHQTLMEILQVRADLIRPIRAADNPQGRDDFRAGLESWFRPDLAFRLGGAWLETRDEMWLTAGIGFKGPRLSFGYAFEKVSRSSGGTRHTFDLWMPF